MQQSNFYTWGNKYRYTILLIGLIAFFILPEIGERVFDYQISFPFILILLVASGTFVIRTRLRNSILKYISIGILLIFLFIWSRYQETEIMGAVAYVLLFFYFFLLTWYLFKDLIQARIVTVPTIIGAFSGYILLGVMWFFIYVFFEAAYPETFSVNIDAVNGIGDMLYFSFVTLTTIGYGDFVPTSSLGQKLVMLEGLVGHFYLAIIMAILVGMYLRGGVKNKQQD